MMEIIGSYKINLLYSETMKQKTHAIIASVSGGLYFILLIIYYILGNIMDLPGGDGFILFIFFSITSISVALFCISYSIFYYLKYKLLPINNYIYALYLLLLIGSLFYIWIGWII